MSRLLRSAIRLRAGESGSEPAVEAPPPDCPLMLQLSLFSQLLLILLLLPLLLLLVEFKTSGAGMDVPLLSLSLRRPPTGTRPGGEASTGGLGGGDAEDFLIGNFSSISIWFGGDGAADRTVSPLFGLPFETCEDFHGVT